MYNFISLTSTTNYGHTQEHSIFWLGECNYIDVRLLEVDNFVQYTKQQSYQHIHYEKGHKVRGYVMVKEMVGNVADDLGETIYTV